VTRTASVLAGGSSIYTGSSLQRHARDAEAVTHHFTVAPHNWEEAGASSWAASPPCRCSDPSLHPCAFRFLRTASGRREPIDRIGRPRNVTRPTQRGAACWNRSRWCLRTAQLSTGLARNSCQLWTTPVHIISLAPSSTPGRGHIAKCNSSVDSGTRVRILAI